MGGFVVPALPGRNLWVVLLFLPSRAGTIGKIIVVHENGLGILELKHTRTRRRQETEHTGQQYYNSSEKQLGAWALGLLVRMGASYIVFIMNTALFTTHPAVEPGLLTHFRG